MRELKIAVGASRMSRRWNNQLISWDDLCQRLSQTIRTGETMDEFLAMAKDQQDRIKDVGGYVMGHLKDGRRRSEDVLCRSCVTLDMDNAEPDSMTAVKALPYMGCAYGTHKNRPENPRLRLIFPLSRDVSAEEYEPVARMLAKQVGMDLFDDSTYEANRCMFWPSTPADTRYYFEDWGGETVDPDAVLAMYADWRDISTWPVSTRQREALPRSTQKQEDPLAKEGIVGTFCRTYTIRDAIQKFLPKVYAPSATEGRYDYIPGESTAGVVIYEDRFAYSHHATDPAAGRLLNAFDLVRLHRFGDSEDSFRQMCALAEADELVGKALQAERAAEARRDFEEPSSVLEPILFSRFTAPVFPTDALPKDIADFVIAVAESTQTPVDMASAVALATLSVCLQGKYQIRGKSDWIEPLNTYSLIIAMPSERKSAVLHQMLSPLNDYEQQCNQRNAGAVESSKMRRRILERRQRAIEDKAAKGDAEPNEMEQIAAEIANFEEEKPLQLYVDDITTEKLVSVISANHGRAALISSEGGIFDTLAGIYTKTVNIDVMLKGYSGDTIRVDRIGRESESIMNPALTVLLMAQPDVVSAVLSNKTFRGRGLTARFLYCMPSSQVGNRRFDSKPIPDDLYQRYERKIVNLLDDEYSKEPQVITLSPEASARLSAFAGELEPKLVSDYSEIADWAGKLVGNVLRIAGLLCRASTLRSHDFLDEGEALVVSETTMKNAIRLGQYFLSSALQAYDVLPQDPMVKQARRILEMIMEKKLTEFDRRTAMRNCRSFKTVAEIQPVLDFLDDYGYIKQIQPVGKTGGLGRPPLPKYIVNPRIEDVYRPNVSKLSRLNP